jgi:radical SAM-linked protein
LMMDNSTAAIRFRIAGATRFLSHAETSRVFQRACARARIPVRHSEGFNPHPRLSLPLPRPVGVESEDELLVVKLCDDREGAPVESRAERETGMKQALAEQLPDGIEVLAVDLVAARVSFHPQSAEYVLPIRVNEDANLVGRLRDEIAVVMERERCVVERASAEGRAARSVDVRPFLRSIRLEGGDLIVQHLTGATGSIRVDEILQLFGLRTPDLAGPVRRTNVTWETTESKNTLQEPCMETRAEDREDAT